MNMDQIWSKRFDVRLAKHMLKHDNFEAGRAHIVTIVTGVHHQNQRLLQLTGLESPSAYIKTDESECGLAHSIGTKLWVRMQVACCLPG